MGSQAPAPATFTAGHPVTSQGQAEPAAPVPVALLARTSTLYLQDPLSSLRRQIRVGEEWLPPGWYIAAYYWDIESGAIDIEDRSQGKAYEQFTAAGIPRDGGLADLLAEAAAPEPRFAAVICEDIERSGRDTFNALKLERELADKGVPLFAADEPADIQGINPTTVLVRRIKQGVAEYFRLQIKKKAWEGLRQHAIAGWNIGPAPYGYQAERVTHPVPIKAAQGRTKTRLALDPQRGPVVAAIYTWRVEEHLGIPTIAARLNADKDRYPPPDGMHWPESTVGAILRNPKYTGHMVFGRRRKTTGRRSQPAPPDQWTWSPEPSHPAIITRAMFDAAQVIGAAHRTASDTLDSAQPRARRNYALRSRVRCRLCQRRMCGSTRSSSRYYSSGEDAWHTYYECTHDPANPRHAALRPDHPRTVSVREDVLIGEIIQFLAQRVFGPERRALLAAQLPASEADAAAQRATHRAALIKELARIDVAQRNQILQIDGLSPDPADKAAQAMRARCSQRFTELHTEREAIETQITTLDNAPARDDHAELLDAIPLLAGNLGQLPERIQAALYQAFDIQLLYRKDMHQVTIWATITGSTPDAVAAIINDASHDPAPATTSPAPAQPAPEPASPTMSALTQRPIRRESFVIVEIQRQVRSGCAA